MENYLTSGGSPKGKLTGGAKGFGYLIAAMGIGAIIWFLYYIAPVITQAIVNTTDLIWASVKCAALFVAVVGTIVVIWKNRNMVSYWYSVAIKLAWTSMIEANPIAGMQYAYDKWQSQAEELNDTIETLRGKESLLKSKMEKRRQEANTYFKDGLAAKKMAGEATGEDAVDLSDAAESNAIMAQRRKESIDMLMPRLQTIQAALDFSSKLYESWKRGLRLLKDDIELKKEDLEVLKSISGALETAKSIISGNTNERVIYEEAIVAYGKEISTYVGKCKRATELVKDYAVNVDIQNAIASDEGKKFLAEYNEQSFAELTDYRKILDASPDRKKITMGQATNQFSKALDTPNTSVNNAFKDLS